MALLLCHECLSWIESSDGWCPECLARVRPDEPDPPLDDLRRRIGDLVTLIGEVRLRRKGLPDRGMLYATDCGLFFVPHGPEPAGDWSGEPAPSASVLFTIAGTVWPMLAPFVSLITLRHVHQQAQSKLEPMILSRIHAPPLPRLLMDDPGVLFLAANSVQLVERRFRHWVFYRQRGSPVRLKPLWPKRWFRQRMREALSLPCWNNVIVSP
ncbi:MAG TPA: hypothetical protein EYP14_01725 [Planctomycetaceae bacterium]|nr:hypothetical protein [Planctomycetaceae bacterium]